MKTILGIFVFLLAFQSYGQDIFKKVGKFNCKSTAVVFPYESPSYLFQLLLEAEISTKEYDLSNADGMSKAKIRLAYIIRKTSNTNALEQGTFQGTIPSSQLPFPNNETTSVHYKIIASNDSNSFREIFMSIPDRFDNYRNFAIQFFIGELDNRTTEQFSLSCRNLDYPY